MRLTWQPLASIICLAVLVVLSFLYGHMLWGVLGLALAALCGVVLPMASFVVRRAGMAKYEVAILVLIAAILIAIVWFGSGSHLFQPIFSHQ